jgi:fucose 4-O-acetylase-like acetyltransferase
VEAAAIKQPREGWVDCCRGICILLMVFGHIAGGLETAGVLAPASPWIVLRDWVYLFHISAFFFLSGLFAYRNNGLPFVPFLWERMRVLYYPYLVWTAIFLGSQVAMAQFVNTPPNFSKALKFLWEPYGIGLWFLYTLFLVSIFFFSLRRWRIPTIPILLIGLAGYVAYRQNLFGFWYVLNASMNYLLFFSIGGCFPGIVGTPLRGARLPFLVAAAVAFFVLMTLLWAVPFDPAGLTSLVRALIGICGVVCVALVLARTPAAGLFALLGTYSLEIYLAHPLWGTAGRALLLRSGIRSPVAFVVFGVSIGIVGSLAMAILSRRLKFPYLFRWPARGRAASGEGAAVGSQN